MARPKILILYTGGTFGMEPLPRRPFEYSVPDWKPAELRKRFWDRVPEMRELADCDVDVLLNLDSSHFDPHHWTWIAHHLKEHLARYSGAIVLHGTDTLCHTACALSFLLGKIDRPVLITGAQRPLREIRTDARRNLISSIELISKHAPKIGGRVGVFFDDVLLWGVHARKKSFNDFQAFYSPRISPLAKVGTQIEFLEGGEFKPLFTKSAGKYPFQVDAKFENKILDLQIHPGFPAALLLKQVDALISDGLKGLLLRGYVSGTGPTHDRSFLELLRKLERDEFPVAWVTEGEGKAPSLRTYSAARELLDYGVLPAGNMTPEAAYLKMGLLLGKKLKGKAFLDLWSRNLVGELSE